MLLKTEIELKNIYMCQMIFFSLGDVILQLVAKHSYTSFHLYNAHLHRPSVLAVKACMLSECVPSMLGLHLSDVLV